MIPLFISLLVYYFKVFRLIRSKGYSGWSTTLKKNDKIYFGLFHKTQIITHAWLKAMSDLLPCSPLSNPSKALISSASKVKSNNSIFSLILLGVTLLGITGIDLVTRNFSSICPEVFPCLAAICLTTGSSRSSLPCLRGLKSHWFFYVYRILCTTLTGVLVLSRNC